MSELPEPVSRLVILILPLLVVTSTRSPREDRSALTIAAVSVLPAGMSTVRVVPLPRVTVRPVSPGAAAVGAALPVRLAEPGPRTTTTCRPAVAAGPAVSEPAPTAARPVATTAVPAPARTLFETSPAEARCCARASEVTIRSMLVALVPATAVAVATEELVEAVVAASEVEDDLRVLAAVLRAVILAAMAVHAVLRASAAVLSAAYFCCGSFSTDISDVMIDSTSRPEPRPLIDAMRASG